MTTKQLTYGQINDAWTGLNVTRQYELPLSIGLKLSLLKAKLKPYVEALGDIEKELQDKHARRDDNGEIIYQKDDKGRKTESFQVNLMAFNEEMDKVFKEEVEVDVPLFSNDELKSILKVSEKSKNGNSSEKDREMPPAAVEVFFLLADEDFDLAQILAA